MNNRKHILWLLLILITVMALAGCQGATGQATEEGGAAPSGDGGEEPAPSGGEVPESLSGGLNLDPANADPADEDSATVNNLVYDRLVTTESDVAVAPGLATSWTVSEDGLDYIFYLRPDATFHDGSPVDADAVIANFNRWFDPEDDLRGSGAYAQWESMFLGFKGETNSDGTPKSTFDGIEKVDNFTILVHLSREDPALLLNLAEPAFSIVNPDVLAANVDSYGTSADTVSGSGAYMVAEWTADSLVLAPYDAYWGGAPESEREFSLQ